MDFKTFFQTLQPQDRELFVRDAGTSLGHLRNVMYGYSPCAPALAVRIERLSKGQVTRQELRPSDCYDIWPDLAPVRASRRKAVA